MHTLILATDERPRLEFVGEGTARPLLNVVDRAVMTYTLEQFARAGLKQLHVALFREGGAIASSFGDGRYWGLELTYVVQRAAWGDAGSLKWAAGLFQETVLLIPGDRLLVLDFEAALAAHRQAKAALTRVLANGQVTGAYLIEPEVQALIPARSYCDIEADLVPKLVEQGYVLQDFNSPHYFNPLTTLQDYYNAQADVLTLASKPLEGDRLGYQFETRQIATGIWVGRNSSIHPSAKLAPPIYIGENCWIGREVELGPASVICSNVVIDDEASIEASTILSESYVGRLVNVKGRLVKADLIVDPESASSTQITDPFLLSRLSGEMLESRGFFFFVQRCIAAAAIAVLSPLLLLVWLLNSIGGRAIVKQLVVGPYRQQEDGSQQFQHFNLMRFRTTNARGQPSRLGRFLRRWQFERLPELFNVLRGEMALVGVRPLTTAQLAELKEPWQEQRHTVPAGFTGLWYLQQAIAPDLEAELVADVYYATTRTWRGDLSIMAQSVAHWWRQVRRSRDDASEADSDQAQQVAHESEYTAIEEVERFHTP
jgi:NDP-sugar pyrophosphorylase family protein